jgi:hypothetical protein
VRKPDICPTPEFCGRDDACGDENRWPPPAPADDAPAPTVCISIEDDCVGTRSVVEHVGHLTNCPACVASADNGV